MENFYLIDFENVHNEGIVNIDSLSKDDKVHIFSTKNALNARMDLVLSEKVEVILHIVPVKKQSVDMHLVSYLGYLLGKNEIKNFYYIISKDNDYNNIVKFWKEQGFSNVHLCPEIPNKCQKNMIINEDVNKENKNTKKANLSGKERSDLNIFVQHEMRALGYNARITDKICKIALKHCNEDTILNNIHNQIKKEFEKECYEQIYSDLKSVLNKYDKKNLPIKNKQKEFRRFFDQHLKKYKKFEDDIIQILLNSISKQQINNELMKIYKNGDNSIVSDIYKKVQPLIKDLPAR